MPENTLPANLLKRLQDLIGREKSYLEDELYSTEAITNLNYRSELEKLFRKDPLRTFAAQAIINQASANQPVKITGNYEFFQLGGRSALT